MLKGRIVVVILVLAITTVAWSFPSVRSKCVMGLLKNRCDSRVTWQSETRCNERLSFASTPWPGSVMVCFSFLFRNPRWLVMVGSSAVPFGSLSSWSIETTGR